MQSRAIKLRNIVTNSRVTPSWREIVIPSWDRILKLASYTDRIMPPKMLKRKAVKKMVKKRVAEAIAEYEKTRAYSDNAGGSGSVNIGGVVAPNVQGCTYKTFMNSKPHPFNRTEGVVGLRRWFEKV
ncbi:hypothetical protein Tco_0035388, partial [Tanacetum coccineum]